MTDDLPLILIGAGGHAGVLVDALKLANRRLLGIIDPALAVGSIGLAGLKVLGDDDEIRRFGKDDVLLINGLGSTRSMARRDEIYRRFAAKGFRFDSVVHPSAVISRSAKLAADVQVMAGVVIQNGVSIAANCIINTRASVDHDCRIGESVHIAPGVTVSGGVSVADKVHVGAGSVIIQGITIGANSVIGAGAVIYRDLPEGSRYIQKCQN